MNKKQIIIGLMIISLLLTPLIIIPNLVFAKIVSDSIIIYACDDAVIIGEYPSVSYGYAESLNVQTSNITGGSPYYYDYNEQTLLQFDYSIMPFRFERETHDNANITSAVLRLYCYDTSNLVAGVTDIEAWGEFSGGFRENFYTWHKMVIELLPYHILEDTQVPSVGWVEWDVTTWFQETWEYDYEDDCNRHISIALKSKVESYDVERRYSRFTSKEECVICTDDDPYLYVKYTYSVPPPVFDFWFMKYILAFIVFVVIVSFAIYVKGGKRY